MTLIIIRAFVLTLIFVFSIVILGVFFNLIFHHNPIAKKLLKFKMKLPLLKLAWVSFLVLSAILVPLYLTYQPNRILNIYSYPSLIEGDLVICTRSGALNIERGQLIVYENLAPKIDLISRVIAKPNDVIMIKNGHININGKWLEQTYQSTINTDGKLFDVFHEKNGDKEYKIIVEKNTPINLNLEKQKLGKNEFLCLLDSRFGYSSLPSNIKISDSQISGNIVKVLTSWDNDSKEFRKERLFIDPDNPPIYLPPMKLY